MPEQKRRPLIVGIGSTVYDTLMTVDRFPTEDTKLQGIETKVQAGGPCATALAAARKLGIPAAYMGTIGDDPFGTFMMDDFARLDIDTSAVRVVPGGVSFHSVVLLNLSSTTRTCIWNKGTVPPPAPEELDLDMLRHARVLHLDGHMLGAALAASRFCRENGVKVSYDAGGTYPGVEALIPLVDYLIPSEEFALKMTGQSTAEDAARTLYTTYRPEVLIITQGVRGGILMDEAGMRRYASYPVHAVDTNGCGDTFHGAFAAGKIQGMTNDAACRYASAAAAIKCTRLGARAAMATDPECRAFLQKNGESLD